MSQIVKVVLGAICFIALLIVFLGTNYTIGEKERGILTRFGQFQSISGPGLHFKLPFVQDVETWRTDVQELSPKEYINTYTVDNQEVDIFYTVFYRVPYDKIEWMYKNIPDYRQRLFTMTNDTVKVAMGGVDVNNVASRRGQIRDTIKETLTVTAKTLGIEITDFKLPDLQYGKTFRQGIEQAAIAKALIEQREQELQQSQKVAQTVVAKAKGEADARILQAQAEATAIKIKGEAEGAAIKARADALAANQQLVELTKAERWNGALPGTMLSNVMPFMNVDKQLANR